MLKKIQSSILAKLGLLFGLMSFLTISSVFFTVYTFHTLKGVSRAIDVSGSERMRSILLGSLLNEYVHEMGKSHSRPNERALKLKNLIIQETNTYVEYLNGLADGSEALGLVAAEDEYVLDQLEILKKEFREWENYIKKALRPEATDMDRGRAAEMLAIENAIHLKQTAHRVVELFESRFRENVARLKDIQKILLASSVLSFLFSIWFLYLIIRPIKEVVSVAHKMAEGNLTEIVKINLKDEIGVLGETMNLTIYEWRKILRQLVESSEKLLVSSSNISLAASEIVNGAKEQVEQVIKTSEAMEEMSGSIQEVSRNAKTTVSYAETASNRLRQGRSTCEETVVTIRKANQKVEELNRKSAEIGKIVHFISGFAEQTNLLAINAAIEAERAGVHGKGFDVVADEIRQLARKTSKFTTDIIADLEDIQREIIDVTKTMNEGSGLMEKTGDFFVTITEDISHTTDRINLISTATAHQVGISGKIADSLFLISGVSRETSNNSMESAEETKKLTALAEQLKTITQKFQINGKL
ncbi:MAG: HAMP domain-containing protein [Nitrospinae bacterium]|nr:HAMP domain-containing protein [Nitrospinota bacterium]